MPNGDGVYFAPDADVLLSETFRRDHCYGTTEGGRDRRGLIGLTFEPRPDRTVGDVRGTVWVDARTFELRFVEYRYTRLDREGAERVGGEVHFARMPSGAWIVRRWFIRMPGQSRYAGPPVGVEGRVPSVNVRPTVFRLLEEGGFVLAEGLRTFDRPATLAGLVTDSAGRPFAGVDLRLDGTPYAATSDAAGRFRFENLPASRFVLIAEAAGYRALGRRVGEDTVALEEDGTRQVTIRAPGSRALVERLCDGTVRARRATLRVVMLDSATGAPLPSLPIRLAWKEFGGGSTAITVDTGGVRAMTDARGAAVFCDLPATNPLQLVVMKTDGTIMPLVELRLGENEIAARTIRLTRPR
jgi:hypothetical protein